jgi:methionine-rich copper-binding protein CopC
VRFASTRLRRAAIPVAVAGAICLASAEPALAHARLLRSSPAKGSKVGNLTELTLVFSDQLNKSLVKVELQDAGGKRVDAGDPEVDGNKITEKVDTPPPGRYTIAYRVVSADGHPIADRIPFTVTADDTPSPGASTPTNPSPVARADEQLKRDGTMHWAVVGGGILLVGAAVGLFAARRRQRTTDR